MINTIYHLYLVYDFFRTSFCVLLGRKESYESKNHVEVFYFITDTYQNILQVHMVILLLCKQCVNMRFYLVERALRKIYVEFLLFFIASIQ